MYGQEWSIHFIPENEVEGPTIIIEGGAGGGGRGGGGGGGGGARSIFRNFFFVFVRGSSVGCLIENYFTFGILDQSQ